MRCVGGDMGKGFPGGPPSPPTTPQEPLQTLSLWVFREAS